MKRTQEAVEGNSIYIFIGKEHCIYFSEYVHASRKGFAGLDGPPLLCIITCLLPYEGFPPLTNEATASPAAT